MLTVASSTTMGVSNSCKTSVSIHYCGDGTLENATTGYPSATEQCDPANPVHGVSCDTTCKWKLPTCDVTLTALANPNGSLPYLNKSGSALATLSGERTAFNFTKISR
jgi:cysteine-rich repeat protein